jgi:hypothetical protein
MTEGRRTPYRAVEAEGARIGLLSCLDCGAVLMLDPDDARQDIDVVSIHTEWHARLNRTLP